MAIKRFSNVKVRRSILATLGLVALLLLAPTAIASADEIVTGDPDALIAEDVVIDDDLIITGTNVVIDGIVLGDVYMSGVKLVVNGTVEGNVFLVGELATINGTVKGNVFGGACALNIGAGASIEHNIRFGGFSLITEQGSHVGRNISALTFQARLSGETVRHVDLVTGAFEFEGNVGGNMHVDLGETCPVCTELVPVETIRPGMRVGEGAGVDGDTTYTVLNERFDGMGLEDIEVASPEVELDLDQVGRTIWGFVVSNFVRRAIGEFVSLLLVGLLLVLLLPSPMERVIEKITDRPLPNLGWGCLTVFLYPLAFLLAVALLALLIFVVSFLTLGHLSGAVISLGGAGIATFSAVFTFVVSLVTKIAISVLIGRWILGRLAPKSQQGRWGMVWSLLVGVFVYEIVRTIPFLGVIAAAVAILIGVGAIVRLLRERIQSSRVAA